MTEPSVDEIVAKAELRLATQEGNFDGPWPLNNNDLRALIASWRERGEALAQSAADERKRCEARLRQLAKEEREGANRMRQVYLTYEGAADAIADLDEKEI